GRGLDVLEDLLFIIDQEIAFLVQWMRDRRHRLPPRPEDKATAGPTTLATTGGREDPRCENGRFPIVRERGFQRISPRPSTDCGSPRTTKNRDLDREFASWKRVLA